MNARVRTILAGYGLAGRFFHGSILRVLQDDFEVVGILERTPGAAAADFPQARVVRDLEALTAIKADLAVLATPSALHEAHARTFLDAGFNVLVDKPAALSESGALALASLARDKGLGLCVYQNRRYDSDFLALRAALASGELGSVVGVESRFDRFRPAPKVGAWRDAGGPGSGVLYDLGPHLVDQALVLFGTPERVSATVRSERSGAADDAFEITLFFEGFEYRCGANCLAGFPTPRFVVRGTKATWRKFGIDPQEAPLREGVLPQGASWGLEPEPERAELAVAAADGSAHLSRAPAGQGDWKTLYRELAKALRGEGKLPVPIEEAARTARILDLAQKSAATGSQSLPY